VCAANGRNISFFSSHFPVGTVEILTFVRQFHPAACAAQLGGWQDASDPYCFTSSASDHFFFFLAPPFWQRPGDVLVE
jgi:hypothetical protein